MPKTIAYDLLLKLYRGSGSAVENLTEKERERIQIDTPMTDFLSEVDASSRKKHIILTGNAGDGKTFALKSCSRRPEEVIEDASAFPRIEDLAKQIEDILRGGSLVIAINRGQMERLLSYVKGAPEYKATLELFKETNRCLALAVEPIVPENDVAVFDLGLFDTLGDKVLDRLLTKVAKARITSKVFADETETATKAAQEALRDDDIRLFVKRTIRHAHLENRHASMRQLWSVVAFLVTGGRAPSNSSPLTLADSVGARLLSEDCRATLSPSYRYTADPNQVPQVELTRALLTESWKGHFKDRPGLKGLIALHEDDRQPIYSTARAAECHAKIDFVRRRREQVDPYSRVVERLRPCPSGWQLDQQITDRVLKGVYRCLGLTHMGSTFPAWSRLVFEARKTVEAGAVAFALVDPTKLRIALPRPNRTMLDAWGEDSWWPPHILLGLLDEHDGAPSHELRLTPSLFRQLWTEDSHEAITAQQLLLEGWLSGAPTTSKNLDKLWVAEAVTGSVLNVTTDPLAEPRGTLRIEWENE